MSPAKYRPPFELQTEIDLAHAGTQESLHVISWSEGATVARTDATVDVFMVYLCPRGISRYLFKAVFIYLYLPVKFAVLYLSIFFFYLFFSLLSQVKERLLVSRTLHCTSTQLLAVLSTRRGRRVAVPCDVRVSAINTRLHSGKT